LRNNPRVLLLDEPTQGVDVGAKAALSDLVHGAAADGAAVLVASWDTSELASVCDRVLVMRDGAVVAEVEGGDLTEERLIVEGLGWHRCVCPGGRGQVAAASARVACTCPMAAQMRARPSDDVAARDLWVPGPVIPQVSTDLFAFVLNEPERG
jgi:energy-coupling factor transporter ATP-binding protein EcfA2